jgi:hypothetical protein
VVLLGAGYDTFAYRFAAVLGRAGKPIEASNRIEPPGAAGKCGSPRAQWAPCAER